MPDSQTCNSQADAKHISKKPLSSDPVLCFHDSLLYQLLTLPITNDFQKHESINQAIYSVFARNCKIRC